MNFFTTFHNFLARVEYECYFEVKFRFHFFCLSRPVLAKDNAGKRFYNFLNFSIILFGIFLPGSSMNGILEKNFVFTFSAYLLPFWQKIMPGGGFITIFEFFGYFFRNFLSRVEYERNSGVKFCFHFFGLSHPVWAKNSGGKRL